MNRQQHSVLSKASKEACKKFQLEILFVRGKFLQIFHDKRNHLVQVAYEAEIRNFEDLRVLVFVDCDNDFGFFHSRKVLDRTGDSAGEVYMRAYRLTGLSDLL